MRTNKNRVTVAIATLTFAIIFLTMALPRPARANITPPRMYSDKEWGKKADKYMSKLRSLQSRVGGKSSRFSLMTMADSNVGGIGFWETPSASGSRYLCVFARVKLPSSSPFPDTKTGRILTVMDAYGKNVVYAIADALQAINDPGLEGAGVIFIYGKDDPNDDSFDASAEAFGLFIPSEVAIRFADLSMTIQSLFSQSRQIGVYVGAEPIKRLRLMTFRA